MLIANLNNVFYNSGLLRYNIFDSGLIFNNIISDVIFVVYKFCDKVYYSLVAKFK